MNYRGLKQAARQCLKDSDCHPRRLTVLFLLCLYAVPLLSDGVSFLLEYRLSRATGLGAVSPRSQLELWTMGSLIAVVLWQTLWNAGFVLFTLRLSRRERAGFQTLTAGFRQMGRILALTLLQGLYIWLWSLLFVIPGIVAAYRYRMALYALLDDENLTASDALRMSIRLTYGHKLELLLLDLQFIWYYLPAFAVSLLTTAYEYGLTPWLQGVQGLLAVSLTNLLLPLAMEMAAMIYVQTTQAHAYNWLKALDQARQESLRSPYYQY